MKIQKTTAKRTVKVCGTDIDITATRGRAIKAFCTDCSNGEPTEVRECPCTSCPLYAYRGYIRWKQVE